MDLAEAQAQRHARIEAADENFAEGILNRVGLSEEAVRSLSESGALLGTANVSPSDREKLKGIVARLRRQTHTFTTCMNDLRKHQPGWSEDRRKRTCNVLKQLTGKKVGGRTSAAEGICALLTDEVAALLEHADLSQLEEEAAA